MSSMWHLGGLTWREIAAHVWHELSEDRILGRSAQLAFYFLLSIFPLLLFVVALAGRLTDPQSVRATLVGYLDAVAPSPASSLVDSVLAQISAGAPGQELSLGLLVTLWAASSGVVAISSALNIAYDVEETRPWWKRRLVAVALTIALMLLVVSVLFLVLDGAGLAARVASSMGLGDDFLAVWKYLQWPVILAFVLFAFNLLYLYAPNLKHWHWHWLMPGTVVGVGLWLLASLGFNLYVRNLGGYGATYGSLGAVVVLLLWFYVTGIAIVVGGEVNRRRP